MRESNLKAVGARYEKAWRSLVAAEPIRFQAKNCISSINDGPAMTSRDERFAAIAGFIETSPDLNVTTIKVEQEERGTVFYWNLKGTNTGPGGSGKPANIDGCEVCKPNAENKIVELKGYIDAEEYERQLNAASSRQ